LEDMERRKTLQKKICRNKDIWGVPGKGKRRCSERQQGKGNIALRGNRRCKKKRGRGKGKEKPQ